MCDELNPEEQLILFLVSDGNWIRFPKIFRDVTGDGDLAIFFTWLLWEWDFYRKRNKLTEDGYFYCKVKKAYEEWRWDKHKQWRMLKRLEELGLIQQKRAGFRAKRFIKIRSKAMINQINKALAKRQTEDARLQ